MAGAVRPDRAHRRCTFVLIPGAGGAAWYWHRVDPLLRAAGHDVVSVDLPAADEAAGLPEYTEAVLRAVGDRSELVVVGQSLGGFTAAMVAARRPTRTLVLLNGMIPLPGETPGQWWANTAQAEAIRANDQRDGRDTGFDIATYFFHDVPDDVTAAAMQQGEPGQSDAVFGTPCDIERWPDVPTRVLIGRDDRFFPAEFQRRLALDRLGVEPDEVPGGHLVALARPVELAQRLLSYP